MHPFFKLIPARIAAPRLHNTSTRELDHAPFASMLFCPLLPRRLLIRSRRGVTIRPRRKSPLRDDLDCARDRDANDAFFAIDPVVASENFTFFRSHCGELFTGLDRQARLRSRLAVIR